MKLRPEHERNFSPVIRAGIYFLTYKGEVVFIGESDHIFRTIIETQDHDAIPFDGFSYEVCSPGQSEWVADAICNLYFPK